MSDKPNKFVGLHAHSVASVFDGLGYASEHIDFAIENGMDALAITDHGNQNAYAGAYLHTKEKKGKGINFKYIPGVEAYFHPSLKQWQTDKLRIEEEIKESKTKTPVADDEDAGTVVENEEESKSEQKFADPRKRRHHLVLLAKSNKGLQNIFTLISRSHKEGFYRYPRMDFNMLRDHGEDVVALSACVAGQPGWFVGMNYGFDASLPLVEGDEAWKKTQKEIGEYFDNLRETLGEENVFAEIQFNKLKIQHYTNAHLIAYAKRSGIKLVATADSHYCRPELWKDREMYKILGRLNKMKEFDPNMLPTSIEELKCELYPKNAEQMWDEYKRTAGNWDFYEDQLVKEAIEQSYAIAHDLIGDVEPDTSMKLPSSVVPTGMTAFQALVEKCKDGLREKKLDKKQKYIERLKEELKVIKEKDFAAYFLTMKAIIDIADKSQLIGCGRGSSAGSLINYLLGITQVDPLKYNLLFSRFLSSYRNEPPDIDSDFADRDQLVDDLKQGFGVDNVVPISNVNTLQLKSLIKDISKFYGIPFVEVNEATKTVDEDVLNNIVEVGENKAAVQVTYDDALKYSEPFRVFIEKYPQVGEHVKILFRQIRVISKHAGGVILAENIDQQMPVITVRGEAQTPWSEGLNVKHLNKFGWIKFDLLGLGTLRMFQRSIELILQRHHGIVNPTFEDIKKWYKENLSPDTLDLDDQEVYKHIYHDGSWAGVFQATETNTQRFFQKFEPTSITDIAAATSICRPGPQAAKVDKLYLETKNDPANVHYEHPLIKQVLGETLGNIVFQEQIMLLGKYVAGLDEKDCDKLRKLTTKVTVSGKDAASSETEILRKKFIDGSIKNGIDQKVAEGLFKKCQDMAAYGFNKSLVAGTTIPVYNNRGFEETVKSIEDVNIFDYVRSRDESTGNDVFIPVNAVHDHGIQPVYEFTLDTGEVVCCTMEHKFRVADGRMLPIKQILEENLDIVVG